MIPEWIKHSKWRWLRPPIGVSLVILGMFGFLPVIGFWMIPLGLAVLAVDFPAAEKALDWLTEKWRAIEALWRAWRKKK
ncbi:MAG: PGPGW domain-containing protein [Rhodoblastus sp.]